MSAEDTDATRILTILRHYEGEWVQGLYQLTGVMVHSRIADLRRRGYRIECKRFAQGDYRYRLVRQSTVAETVAEYWDRWWAEPSHWDERGMPGG